MDANRKAAVSAGVLFIIATAAALLGSVLYSPLLSGTDYLTRVAANPNQVTGGALLGFIAAGASVGIAIALYPVLKKWNAGLALGSVVFRTIEAVGYIAGVVGLLSLLSVSQQFTRAGASDRAAFQAIGDSLLGVRESAATVAVLAFILGALMYYYVFYQSRLIPRWLSGFGMAAIALMLVADLLAWFSNSPVTSYVILAAPIAVQEIVLAVWLIVKGFSSRALQSRTASNDSNAVTRLPLKPGVAG
jgi:Domain of unknown function (DUF4386)